MKAETQNDICTPKFVKALFNIVKRWKQPVFIDKRMDSRNVAYTYNVILFSLKKEENPDICHNMDDS